MSDTENQTPDEQTNEENAAGQAAPENSDEVTPHEPATMEESTGEKISPDLNMLMDVNMSLSIEIGRTQMKLRELLSLSKGTVIELNKLSGEPLDILANGKLIAHGDVIAVNGKYGIRLTDVAGKNKLDETLETQTNE